jgi:tetratricopeptide (TPR) repeat protein
MYNYVGDSANSAIYLRRFLEINTEDISDLFKIATTLCELKEHALALKYLKLILKQKPYDTNILFLTAIASYNNKLINEAVDIFITLLKLNEKDYAAKYYLKLIRQAAKEKDIEKGFFQPLEYICQVPYGEMLERIKKLRGILIDKNALKQETGRDEILELCDWSSSVSDLKFQKLIIGRLLSVKDERVQDFLKEKLLDPKVSLYAKRFIIEKCLVSKHCIASISSTPIILSNPFSITFRSK